MAVPTSDSRLVDYTTNFDTRGTATPAAFSLTAAQMTQYSTLSDAYLAAIAACKAPGAKSKALVQDKQDKKALLIAYARQLYGIIQASPSVTNENKTLIGVTVRSNNPPSPVPPPSQSPLLTVLSVTGRSVRLKLADRQFPHSRRRPANARAALILSFVGQVPPAPDAIGWVVEGETGKQTFTVSFADDVQPGTLCWVTAMWVSPRGQFSPACAPVQTYLQIGPSAEAA